MFILIWMFYLFHWWFLFAIELFVLQNDVGQTQEKGQSFLKWFPKPTMMEDNIGVPDPTIVLKDPNESHSTSKLLTCKQMCQLMNNPWSWLDISQVLDIRQLSKLHNTLPGGGLLDGRDFPARDLDEPGVISLLSSPSLRGTSSLGWGWLGQCEGIGQPSLLMPSLVVWLSEVLVGFRPTWQHKRVPWKPSG